jgi:hypothetical protein
MSLDLMDESTVALELEASILLSSGLVLSPPHGCLFGCTFSVVARYPGKPWYWVLLLCRHRIQAKDPDEVVVARYDWFTPGGERVSVEELERYQDHVNVTYNRRSGTMLVTCDGKYFITRFGAVYGEESYNEPAQLL